MAFKPCGSARVRLIVGVLAAVRLDDEAALDTGEIDDERTDGALAPEFVSKQSPVAQHRPWTPFDIGHGLAEFACRGEGIAKL